MARPLFGRAVAETGAEAHAVGRASYNYQQSLHQYATVFHNRLESLVTLLHATFLLIIFTF